MTKKQELKAILDRHLADGKYTYVDDGDDSVRLSFNQAEVSGEVSISDVGILNLFLAILGGIDNLGKKSSEGCEVTFFLDLINFVTKKLGRKKKGIRISQKDWRLSLKHREILIFSFSKDIVLSLENQIRKLCRKSKQNLEKCLTRLNQDGLFGIYCKEGQ
jgi:hypothetical protein